MSLARGLTLRLKRPDAPTLSPPARSKSVKVPGSQIDRAKISAPVALVSTTNMLSYNAPDLATLRQTSATSSALTHIEDDSDHSVSTRSRASSHASRDTMTDASSVSSSPTSTSPAPNHLSGYFAAANKSLRKSVSSGNLQQVKETVEDVPVPAIPERALSHSKRAHERVAHKRSLQGISRASSTRSSHQQRSSVDMFSSTTKEESHPFGPELEQLNEVVEEFHGVTRDAEFEADLTALRVRKLARFCAADYLAEIQPLFSSRFGLAPQPAPLAWI